MNKKNKNGQKNNLIAENRRARHDYSLEQTFEAGLVLKGWEVKSLRAGKGNVAESYVIIKNGEIWLLGAQITPLLSASTHIIASPKRTRKLLLNKKEIRLLIGATERKGYTLVPLRMYWHNRLVKLSFALAKGKKLHDKRQTLKEKEWRREASQLKKVSR